jgi:hypothetical protein
MNNTDRDNSIITTTTTKKMTTTNQQKKFLHVIATDVSSVCITQQKERQQRMLLQQCNISDPDVSSSLSSSTLEYDIFNITTTDVPQQYQHQFDMVLDKGCFDTCIFRSNKNTIDQWIPTVITNIVHCLIPQKGIYAVITPRNKIKYLRDSNAFRSVTRTVLSSSQYLFADIEVKAPTKNNNDNNCNDNNSNTVSPICYDTTSTEPSQQPTKQQNKQKTKEPRQYIYTCRT